MGTILDYAKNAKEPFSLRSFGAADSLLLSQIAGLHWDGWVPRPEDADTPPVSIQCLAQMPHGEALFQNTSSPPRSRDLWESVLQNPRFRNIKLWGYVGEESDSAVTFCLEDGTAFLAFADPKGLAERENLLALAFSPAVSMWKSGIDYIHTAAQYLTGNLMVGGYAAGGNWAVYGAAKCDPAVQSRITHVWSHDAPGFADAFYESEGFSRLANRVQHTLPGDALLSMLLLGLPSYAVMQSKARSLQTCDPFSWEVDGTALQPLETVKRGTLYRNTAVHCWLQTADELTRQRFLESLLQGVQAGDVTMFYKQPALWQEKALSALRTCHDLNSDSRSYLLQTIGALFYLGSNRLFFGEQ